MHRRVDAGDAVTKILFTTSAVQPEDDRPEPIGRVELPQFFRDEPCEECGQLEAECHLCHAHATHFVEIPRGTFYLCQEHSVLARRWEQAGFGEWGAYAPTVDCECDPWRWGSPV